MRLYKKQAMTNSYGRLSKSRKTLEKKSQTIPTKPALNESEDFYFPTFHLGKFDEVSHEQLYDDMSERFAFDTSI